MAVYSTIAAMEDWQNDQPDELSNSMHFSTTRWSQVMVAGQRGTVESDSALERLCKSYWPPKELQETSGRLVLSSPGLHLWQMDLQADDLTLDSWKSLLTDEELQNVARYKFPHLRRRSLVCRAKRKAILSQYLNCLPQDVNFETNSYGKPNLAGDSSIRFNLSHCEDLALLAVTRGRDVGVDIERIRPNSDADGIATRYFSSEEATHYEQAPPEQKALRFFTLWTLKEAYMKAVGLGLAMPLDSFAILPHQGGPSATLLRKPTDCVGNWEFRSFSITTGYIAALAIETSHGNFHALDSLHLPPIQFDINATRAID